MSVRGVLSSNRIPACEVLKSMGNCISREKSYFELVERVKPDYLFMIHR